MFHPVFVWMFSVQCSPSYGIETRWPVTIQWSTVLLAYTFVYSNLNTMLTYVKSGSIFHLYVLFFHCMFLSENILMVITITMFHLQINNIMTKLKSKAPIFFQMAHIKNKCGLLSMSLATLHGLYVLLFLLCIV